MGPGVQIVRLSVCICNLVRRFRDSWSQLCLLSAHPCATPLRVAAPVMRMRGSLLLVALAALIDVASPLKILCLHGGGGDGPSFQSDPGMVALESSLGSTFEFVYASGPYAGGLWIMDPPGGKNQPTTDPNWASQSVAVLDNLVATQGPFHGLLGYSQGTAMALTYLASAPTSTFEVVMLFCGYIPTTHTGLTNSISAASPFGGINALVWMGANDFIITNAQCAPCPNSWRALGLTRALIPRSLVPCVVPSLATGRRRPRPSSRRPPSS